MEREYILAIGLLFISVIVTAYYAIDYKNLGSMNKIEGSKPNGLLLTFSEIAKHDKESDCWQIINGKVYDVTDFLSRHPGGSEIMIKYCGKDATQAYLTKEGRGEHSSKAYQLLSSFYIGDVNSNAIEKDISQQSGKINTDENG